MSSDRHPFAEAEAWLRDHRPHVITHLEKAMKYLAELIADRKTLIGDIATQTARADAAEAKVADLESQISADEATAKAALDADTAADTSTKPATTSAVLTSDPVSTSTSTTATTADGATVTLDHATGEVTATAADGSSVEPHPEVKAAVVDAATAAGA